MYVIVKNSRAYAGGPGYAGPSCPPDAVSWIYPFRSVAERDAAKLSLENPVGFHVEAYRKPPYEHKPWRYELHFAGGEPAKLAIENKGRRSVYKYSDKNNRLLNELSFRYLCRSGYDMGDSGIIWWTDFRA